MISVFRLQPQPLLGVAGIDLPMVELERVTANLPTGVSGLKGSRVFRRRTVRRKDSSKTWPNLTEPNLT